LPEEVEVRIPNLPKLEPVEVKVPIIPASIPVEINEVITNTELQEKLALDPNQRLESGHWY
jgi:hypothetical protein